MKILIVSDFEGISGVYRYEQAYGLHPEYWESRHLMSDDVNAAVRGLRRSGATEIDVLDCHGDTTRNIDADMLVEAQLLPKGFDMAWTWVYRVESAYDAVALVGYHAMAAASDAYMPHTLNPEWRVWFNGMEIGEAGMIAGIAGEHGVPTILATGDEALVLEMRAIIPQIEAVAVKTARSRAWAECMPVDEAHRLIESAAQRALQRKENITPWTLDAPVEVRQAFLNADSADLATILPGSRRLDSTMVGFTADSFSDAVLAVRAMERLAMPVRSQEQEHEISTLNNVKTIQRKWLKRRMEAWLGSLTETSTTTQGYFA